jgi:hypothetical protein
LLDTEGGHSAEGSGDYRHIDRAGIKLKVVRATVAELESHQRQLDLIDKASDEGVVWRKIDA